MTSLDNTAPTGDALVDSIVDGAFSPAELRSALDRLDREPDGWKHCTLAFLEAQCWQQTIRQMSDASARAPSDVQPGMPPILAGLADRRRRPWLPRVMAAAAAAAAFGLGWLARDFGAGPSLDRAAVERPTVASARPVAEPQHAQAPSIAAASASVDLSAAQLPLRPATQVAGDRGPVQLVGRIRLGAPGGEADVPILAGPGIDAEWLKNQPPPISDYGQAVLGQLGYKVDQQRQLIPATLADGRRVAVPLDLVEIRYTGNDPL